MARPRGEVGRTILALLLGGLALGLSGSPRRYAMILRQLKRELRRIEYEAAAEAVRKLYRSKLVDYRENSDGTVSLLLTEHGKRRVLSYKLDQLSIPKPRQWDGKWRLVMFDIPERFKKARDALRMHLKQLGFLEFQRSVFVHPFECRGETDFIIEFYQIRPWVRYATVEAIDVDFHLRLKFRRLIESA